MRVLRWTARILSALLALLLLVIFVGEFDASGFQSLDLRESLMMLFIFAVWCGYFAGWKSPGAGSFLILMGMTAFYASDIAFSGTLPNGPVFPLMIVPGALYLTQSLLERQQG